MGDLSYALRTLRAQPGFTCAAAGTLALVIGLNTSLFTVFNAVALRPWPVKDPGRVVSVFSVPRAEAGTRGFALAEFRYFCQHARSLAGLVAFRGLEVRLGDDPKHSRAELVSGEYFRVLGVEMALGRSFLPDEDRLGAPQPVAVLSHAQWQNRFGSSRDVLDRQLDLDGVPFRIVGVAAPEFSGTTPEPQAVWVPLASVALLRPQDPFTAGLLDSPDVACCSVAARLTPGVAREQARAELEVLDRQFRPTQSGGILLASALGVLALALASVGMVGVFAYAVRSRTREIAMRLALGARPLQVIRLVLFDSSRAVRAGLAAGVLAATAVAGLIQNHLFGVGRLDPPAYSTVAALVVLCALAASFLPARMVTRVDPAVSLRYD